jgi:hypothetical protein
VEIKRRNIGAVFFARCWIDRPFNRLKKTKTHEKAWGLSGSLKRRPLELQMMGVQHVVHHNGEKGDAIHRM